MVSLLTAVAITSLSYGDETMFLPLAIMLALSVGVFQITLAFAKAGKLIDIVLKEHVILGFTSAAALIMVQTSKVFGLNNIAISDLLNIRTFLEQTPINYYAVLMSIIALAVLYIFKNKLPNINSLQICSSCSCCDYYFGVKQISRSIVGNIPQGLPVFSFKTINIGPDLIFMFVIHTV